MKASVKPLHVLLINLIMIIIFLLFYFTDLSALLICPFVLYPF